MPADPSSRDTQTAASEIAWRFPSSRELLVSAGVSFDYFVDSFEGVQIPLNSAGIHRLADAARARLQRGQGQ